MNSVKNIVFYSFFLLTQLIYPQELKIIRIADSNLFQTEDGSYVKLAGIDMPRLDNPDYFLYKTALDAVDVSKKLLNRSLRYKIIRHESQYDLVYIYKDYLLGSKLLNLMMLEKGFGRYINNIDLKDTSSFIAAQSLAMEHSSGIWKSSAPFSTELFDAVPGKKQDAEFRQDSLNYEMNKYPKPGAGRVIAEFLIGTGTGLAASGAAVGITMLAYPSGKDGIKYNGLHNATFFTTFTLVTASTVYGLSKNTSKKVSYGYTVLSSVIGAGIGGFFIALVDYSHMDLTPELISLPLIFSALAPVLYVNTVAPDRFQNAQLTQNTHIKKKNITAEQLYNISKQFDIELFRYNF